MASVLRIPVSTRPRTFGVLPTLVAAALVYAALWPVPVPDITQSYAPWLEHIARVGPLRALGSPFGDYTPPYYYLLAMVSPLVGWVPSASLVKLVSLAGTLLLAGAVARLARALDIQRADLIAAATLLLPGVALNTALMGQCDALAAAPLVMALVAVIGRRPAAMFIWCGIAVAVKAQAVFGAPFFLAAAIRWRAPWQQWALAPAATLAVFAPAMVLGWPLQDLLTIYLRQAGFFETLSMNAPNVWAIVQSFRPAVPLTGFANAAALCAAVAYVAHFGTRALTDRAMVAAAALAPLIVVGLLPRMHERYFYPADVLVFVWAAASGYGRDWVTAGLVQLGSLLGIAGWASGRPEPVIAGGAVMMIATWRLARPLVTR